MSVWAISSLGVVVRHIFCGCCCFFFSPPGNVAFWDYKTAHKPVTGRVSYCLETSPPTWLPPQDESPSLTLLPLFLSFIFCPTSFWREWAPFLGAWYTPSAFRRCFVDISHHWNYLLINLWGRNWSPHPISLPSWDLLFFQFSSIQSLSSVRLFETHGLQHARLPSSSPTPRACSNSCQSSWWCHPTISSSVIHFSSHFSSHLQSFLTPASFPMSQFFSSGGQSIETSASASVLPMNI